MRKPIRRFASQVQNENVGSELISIFLCAGYEIPCDLGNEERFKFPQDEIAERAHDLLPANMPRAESRDCEESCRRRSTRLHRRGSDRYQGHIRDRPHRAFPEFNWNELAFCVNRHK
jgi:hypothetical protein